MLDIGSVHNGHDFLRVRSVSNDYVTTANIVVWVLNNVLNKYLQLVDTVVFRPNIIVLVGWA